MSQCFLCGKIQTGWSRESLIMLREMFKLCRKHLEFVETELSKQPPVATKADEPTQPIEPTSAVTEFLPPIIEQKPHYTERNPGEEG